IIFLPAVGVVAMIVPTFAQRPVVGYSWIVLAAVGTAFISFGLWVHHMYTTGLPLVSLSFFSAASEAVVIPTGVQLFAFIATLLAGKVKFETPMLFVMGFLFIFVAGGLTGVMVAIVPFDWQVHDSYFIVAHLHHTLIGGMLFPMLAALYYWMPVVSGRMMIPFMGRLAFWLLFIGFLTTFFPMHFTGLLGMPRRVWTYPEGLGWDELNMASTIGAFVFASGMLVLILDVILHFKYGEKARRNPWNAGTLDWMMEIPPKEWGARSVPIITSRYPVWEQENFLDDVDKGRFLIPDAPQLKRETVITSVVSARPVQVLRVPGPSWWPLLAALGTGGFFLAATWHYWTIALVSAAIGFIFILLWVWDTGQVPEQQTRDAGRGYRLPLYASGPDSVGWWALFITILGDATAFVSLVFAYFFLWTVNEVWPPPLAPEPDRLPPAILAGVMVLISLMGRWSWKTLARQRSGPFRLLVWSGTLAWLGVGTVELLWLLDSGLVPTEHAYPATVWILAIYHLLHIAVAVIMGSYCLVRWHAGRLRPGYDIDIRNTALFWHFTALMGLVVLGVITLFPLVA
ncbi:MAG: cbb3-type cytochrome c oxidase subunit I, partial [Candidatus Competibacteraceae bacterium]|nr:cbb3-type cytochrome c oxidase subunit I [Candidatus Competibacteraceae bacterium]